MQSQRYLPCVLFVWGGAYFNDIFTVFPKKKKKLFYIFLFLLYSNNATLWRTQSYWV